MPTVRTRRILVVDGNEALRSLLVRALSGDGYEVIAVPPGAAEDPSAGAGTYDLVVTGEHDVPPMDGAGRDGQEKDTHPPRPTLHLDELSRGDLMDAERPFGYRPFSIELLLDRVRRRLSERQAE